MAGHELIDDYLSTLRLQLGWRADADDIRDEFADHLLSAVEAREAEGVPAVEAQQEVIAGFGDSSTVSLSFASSGSRGLALPTEFTRSGGIVGLVAAAAWFVYALAWFGSYVTESSTGDWEGLPFILFLVGTVALMGAAWSQVILLFSLDRRHGGLGLLGMAGIGVSALGALATLVSWFVPGWASLLAVGFILASLPILIRGLVPRLPVVIVMIAWPIALATFSVLNPMKLGRIDSYGDYPLPFIVASVTGAVITAIGLALLGRWLSVEKPADAGLQYMAAERRVKARA